jgi:hypothetical protein|nr:MAG TPA: hypothetical protein [Caudoviricetes sp.]
MSDKIPYVHEDIVTYLDDLFNFDSLLSALDGEQAEYQIGYMKGVRDIINHLRAISEEQNER